MSSTATLHILSRSNATLLATLQRSVATHDGLLLCGDGVYAAFSDQPLPANTQALRVDVEARGLLLRWPASIALTDHAGFVDLCVQYARSLSWS